MLLYISYEQSDLYYKGFTCSNYNGSGERKQSIDASKF